MRPRVRGECALLHNCKIPVGPFLMLDEAIAHLARNLIMLPTCALDPVVSSSWQSEGAAGTPRRRHVRRG